LKQQRSIEEILTDDTELDDELVEKISERNILSDGKINAIINDGLSKINSENQNKGEIKIDVIHKRRNFSYAAAFLALTACLTIVVNIIFSKNAVPDNYDSVSDTDMSTEITINSEHQIHLYSESFHDEGIIDTGGELVQYMTFSGNILYVFSSDYSFRNLKLTAYSRDDRKTLFSEDIDDEGWIKHIKEDNGELKIIYQYKDNLKSVSFSADKKLYNGQQSSISVPDTHFIEGVYDCEILFCTEANGFMNYDFVYIRNDGAVYGYKEKNKKSYLITSDISSENGIFCAAADRNGIALLL